jgi:hypothetical protein
LQVQQLGGDYAQRGNTARRLPLHGFRVARVGSGSGRQRFFQEKDLKKAKLRSGVCQLVVFYPTQSLARQISAWSGRRGDCRVEIAGARRASEVRDVIDRADAVLVDATGDNVQAVDALVMALGGVGVAKTAVYTERMHEGLEPFVRRQGVLLLFGPLRGAEWEGFFERFLPGRRPGESWKLVA